MLSCQEVTELVTAYVEGQMPLVQRMQFKLHIGMCKHCREYLAQMRTTHRLTGALPAEPMPTEVRDELARRLAAMRKQSTDTTPEGEPERS